MKELRVNKTIKKENQENSETKESQENKEKIKNRDSQENQKRKESQENKESQDSQGRKDNQESKVITKPRLLQRPNNYNIIYYLFFDFISICRFLSSLVISYLKSRNKSSNY